MAIMAEGLNRVDEMDWTPTYDTDRGTVRKFVEFSDGTEPYWHDTTPSTSDSTSKRRKYESLYTTPRGAYEGRSARSTRLRDIPGRYPEVPLKTYLPRRRRAKAKMPIIATSTREFPDRYHELPGRWPDSPIICAATAAPAPAKTPIAPQPKQSRSKLPVQDGRQQRAPVTRNEPEKVSVPPPATTSTVSAPVILPIVSPPRQNQPVVSVQNGQQQRAPLTRIEPNKVSIPLPKATIKSALAKPRGPLPAVGPLGILKFIRNFQQGKPPPPPLVTKHFAESHRKSVGFYRSPETGGPVLGTKRFKRGQIIGFPSPASTQNETTMEIHQTLENQLHDQSLMDAQLLTLPSSEIESGSLFMRGGANPDSTNSDAASSAQPGDSQSEPVVGSSDLTRATDGGLSGKSVNEQGSIPYVEGSKNLIMQSIENWDDGWDTPVKRERPKPKPVRRTKYFKRIISDDAPKKFDIESLRAHFTELDVMKDFAGLAPRRASKRLEAQQKKETEEKAAREKKGAEEKAQREKEEAELRAQIEREAEEQRQRLEEERQKLGVRHFTRESIIRPLNAYWTDQVNKAMATSTRKADPLVTTVVQNTPLSRSDFGKVLPMAKVDNSLAWLNDAIISGYLEMVTEMGNFRAGLPNASERKRGEFVKYHAFNPYLFKKLNGGGYSGVKNWATKAGIGGRRLLDTECIFIPVNVRGNHWTLATVSGVRRTIEYWDSMQPKDATNPVECVKKWLIGELGSSYKEDEWTVKGKNDDVDIGKGPEQDNGSDCGVFAITTAKMIALGIDPMVYSARDMPLQRRRVVAELLNRGFHGDFAPEFEFI